MRRTFAVLAVALALALLVVACGGSSGDETTPAATGAADGAQLFADNCAGCHGTGGGGGTGPDLRSEDNLDKVVEKVTTGDDPMPSFQGQLSPAEIQAVAAYVVDQL